MREFGFGQPTGIDLPGEAGGLLRPVERWGRIHLVTTAFGQGIAVTPLQLARAFAAIANGGQLMRPYVVRRITGADGDGALRRRRRTSRASVDVARRPPTRSPSCWCGVTENGTGKQARIDGFTVAGKTGTAQKVDPHTGRYCARDRMSSFVGFVPAEKPALVVIAGVIDTPRTATYGGVVAAPVFRAVAEYGLARRGVLPSVAAAPSVGAAARRRRSRRAAATGRCREAEAERA